MIIASLLTDFGQHIRVETSENQRRYWFIPKSDIKSTGRSGDYGVINLAEIQRAILKDDTIRLTTETVIGAATYTDLDDLLDAVNLILKFAPATNEAILTKPVVGLSAASTTLQKGDPASTLNLNYSVDKMTYNISSVLLDGINIKTGSGSQSGTSAVRLISDTDKRYTLEVEDLSGNISSAYVDVRWLYACYYMPSTLDSTSFQAMISRTDVTEVSGLLKQLQDETEFETEFDCTGGAYMYFMFPYAWGSGFDLYVGDMLSTDYDLHEVNIDDDFGIARDYYLVAVLTEQTASDVKFKIVWH